MAALVRNTSPYAPWLALIFSLAFTACDQDPAVIELRSATAKNSAQTSAEALYQDIALTATTSGSGPSSGAGQEARPPIMELASHQVCAGVVYRDRSGAVRKGSKDCGPFKACQKTGDTRCVTTTSLRAGDRAKVLAEHITAGTEFLGVTGSFVLKNFPSCTDTNQQDCVSTSAIMPIERAILQPGNIKKGQVIAAGLVGDFPSVRHPLPGLATGSVSLAAAGINTAASSAGRFHFWDHEGKLSTVSGDPRLTSDHIILSKNAYGVRGTASNVTRRTCTKGSDSDCQVTANYTVLDTRSIDARDFKKGVVVAGVTGVHPSATSLLFGSTNNPDLSFTDYSILSTHAPVEYFTRTGQRYTRTGEPNLRPQNIKVGATIYGVKGTLQGYDLDDFNRFDLRGGMPMPFRAQVGMLDPTIWCPNPQHCLSSYWQDITPKIAGEDKACHTGSTTCAFRTFNQLVDWSFPLKKSDVNWLDAVRHCRNLNLYGKTNWRMPTQKEFLLASAQSLATIGVFNKSHFKTNYKDPIFWTSTAFYFKSDTTDPERFVYDANGDEIKTASPGVGHHIACVRELDPAEAAQAKSTR